MSELDRGIPEPPATVEVRSTGSEGANSGSTTPLASVKLTDITLKVIAGALSFKVHSAAQKPTKEISTGLRRLRAFLIVQESGAGSSEVSLSQAKNYLTTITEAYVDAKDKADDDAENLLIRSMANVLKGTLSGDVLDPFELRAATSGSLRVIQDLGMARASRLSEHVSSDMRSPLWFRASMVSDDLDLTSQMDMLNELLSAGDKVVSLISEASSHEWLGVSVDLEKPLGDVQDILKNWEAIAASEKAKKAESQEGQGSNT